MSRRKTSIIWDYFSLKPKSDYIAICNLCKQELSYKSTSSNLKKHLERKHPLVKLSVLNTEEEEKKDGPTLQQVSEKDSDSLGDSDAAIPSTSKKIEGAIGPEPQPKTKAIQSSVKGYLNKKLGSSASKKIDNNLMLLFIKDFQPFSVVEDYGFKKFVNALNPSYQLPSRKTITNVLLPAAYEQAYNKTKDIMKNVNAVTLTTDCWTSCNTENFMAVTAHFINNNYDVKNVLLECISFGEAHTSANLATELKKVIDSWELHEKILIVVSDNAANIKKAIKDDLKLRHFGCYAHTINLIVGDALKDFNTTKLLEKIKTIVGHFKRSTHATAKFQEQQKAIGKEPKKLIQDVPTRWNSTFYMLERFIELEEPIRTTLALIDKNLPIISNEEWTFFKELVQILKPMETITKITSGEQYVTASSIIVMTEGLLDIYTKFQKETHFASLAKKIITTITDGIKTRLGDLENSNSLIISTFLDPRFKHLGFSNDHIAERAKKAVISIITNRLKTDSEVTPILEIPPSEIKNDSIWGSFDKKRASFQPTGTAQSRAIIEVQRYLEDQPISRNDDPIQWWKNNAYNYPNLSQVVKEKFITVITSVPCERLFSKSGQILSDRRNRLSSEKVKSLLFLNANQQM